MLNEQDLGAYLRRATRTLFRLETLPAYAVPTDGSDFQRYLNGEPEPTMERKNRWLDRLRKERAQGLYRHRVRVLRTPLSEYDRYACEWGYAYNVPAGDDTRILDLTTHPVPSSWVDHDFWLIDDAYPVQMHYDEGGQFLGAEVVSPTALGRYQAARDALWQAAEPFETWWQRHPEFHRATRVAS